MTDLTTAQLDELERETRELLDRGCVEIALVPAAITLRLVAIARAALVWSEARRLHIEGYPDGQPEPPDDRTLAYFAARDALLAALEEKP